MTGRSHRYLQQHSVLGSEPVDKKYSLSIHDIRLQVNYFKEIPLNLKQCKNVAFFLTNTFTVALLDFMEINFLVHLKRKSGWRLYIPEIVLEYLKYLQKVQHPSWSIDLPSDILQDLLSNGQIVILREGPENVPELSSTTIVTAYVSFFHPEYLVIALHLNSHKVEMPMVKNPVVKLNVMNSLKLTNQPESTVDLCVYHDQTPQYSSTARTGSYSWRASRLEAFRSELQRLGTQIQNHPTAHFEVSIRAPNEFVAFWYLRQFWLSLKLKTHVTSPLAEFARKFLPNADEYIFADNSDKKCRLHFDCCAYTSNEMCVPNQEWGIEFEVERIFIGYCPHTVGLFHEYDILDYLHFCRDHEHADFQFPFVHPDCDHV